MKSALLLAPLFAFALQGTTQAQCLTGNDVGLVYDADAPPPAFADPTSQGWTLNDLSMGSMTSTSIQPGPENFWRIDDQNAGQMGRLFYSTPIPAPTWTESERFGWQLEFRVDPLTGKEGFVEVITGNDGGNVRYSVHFDTTGGPGVVARNADSVLIGSMPASAATYFMTALPNGVVELFRETAFGQCLLIGAVPPAAVDIATPVFGGQVRFGSGWTPNNGSNTGICDFNGVNFRTLGAPVGSVYCSPAQPSPLTGLYAELEAYGWDVASYNAIEIRATNCPPSVAAVMFIGPTQGFVPFAGGSNGHLCIVGTFGRYSGGLTDSLGGFTQVINTNGVPMGSLPLMPVVAGSNLNMQLWYRDALTLGGPTVTSNFSEAVNVPFL